MSLLALIKKLESLMRKDNGIDGVARTLSQVVWLLFLKVYDYIEEINELTILDYQPVIPEGYRWRDWAKCSSIKEKKTGPELLDFVNNELFPVLKGDFIKDSDGNEIVIFDKTDKKSLLVKRFMSDALNYMKNGYVLRQVVDLFDEVDLDDSTNSHDFNHVYETLLKGLQEAGKAGEFYSPRALTSYMTEKVNPKIGESMADLSCGTGGFFVDTINHLKKQVGADVESYNFLQDTIHGIEWKPLPYMLCITNLLLNKIELPDIVHDTAFSKNYSEYTEKDSFDVILMNPPYGGVATEQDKMSFPSELRSSETSDLFMALIIKRLKRNGRAAVILPDGFLFGTDASKFRIKEKLFSECNVHTVIRLPKSCFAPYTTIATNIIFFDKKSNTSETWFYRMDMPEGYKSFSKSKPLSLEHMAVIDEWWNNRTEIKDTDTDSYKAKKYTLDEIKELEYNIDLCGFPQKDDTLLEPKELINEYRIKREGLNSKISNILFEIESLLGVE